MKKISIKKIIKRIAGEELAGLITYKISYLTEEEAEFLNMFAQLIINHKIQKYDK